MPRSERSPWHLSSWCVAESSCLKLRTGLRISLFLSFILPVPTRPSLPSQHVRGDTWLPERRTAEPRPSVVTHTQADFAPLLTLLWPLALAELIAVIFLQSQRNLNTHRLHTYLSSSEVLLFPLCIHPASPTAGAFYSPSSPQSFLDSKI